MLGMAIPSDALSGGASFTPGRGYVRLVIVTLIDAGSVNRTAGAGLGSDGAAFGSGFGSSILLMNAGSASSVSFTGLSTLVRVGVMLALIGPSACRFGAASVTSAPMR